MSHVILITGTSTGMGKLTALTLAKAGHTIIAAMRDTKGKNQAVANELAAVRNIEVLDLDVTSDQSVEAGIRQVISKHGRIDVLVNNAGVSGYGVAEAYTLDQVRQMFDVNFYGVYRTYLGVLPHMRAAKSGLIINLSTGASGFTLPFMVPYFASKFAMEALVEGFDLELKPYNIENVSIASGVYPTEMNNGSKTGISASKQTVVSEYGDQAAKQFEALGGALFGKMADFKMNPQTIADGILKLIEMPKGKRPLRVAMDAVAQGADQEFIDTRAAIKDKWVKNYGFPI